MGGPVITDFNANVVTMYEPSQVPINLYLFVIRSQINQGLQFRNIVLQISLNLVLLQTDYKQKEMILHTVANLVEPYWFNRPTCEIIQFVLRSPRLQFVEFFVQAKTIFRLP